MSALSSSLPASAQAQLKLGLGQASPLTQSKRSSATHSLPSEAGPNKSSGDKQVGAQFEQLMVRQLLAPLEESLNRSSGGAGSSPMVGGLILDSLSQGIVHGGGLGLADVIDQALRKGELDTSSSASGSPTALANGTTTASVQASSLSQASSVRAGQVSTSR